MAISFVGGTTGTGTGASYAVSLSGTLTGGSATSPASGDLIVVFAGHGNTASSAPTCSGNTSGSYIALHTAIHSNDTWDTEFCTFYQYAGDTPDTSLTIGRTNNTTFGGATVVLVFRDAGLVTATSTSGINGAAVNPPSVTPTVAGSWVAAGGTGMLSGTDTAGMTAISNMTAVRNAYGNGSTSDASTIAGYFSTWSSGAFDPATATGGTLTNTSSSWAASTVLIEPRLSLISTFTDDFSSGSLGAQWVLTPGAGGTGSQTVVSEQFQQTFTTAVSDFEVATSSTYYSLTGTRAFVKLVQPVGQSSTTGAESKLQVYAKVDDGSNASILWRSDGNVETSYTNTSTTTSLGTTAYTSANFAWLGIRADGTTLFFDRAPSTASNPPASGDWVNVSSVARSSLNWNPEAVSFNLITVTSSALGVPTQPTIWDGVNTATSTGTSVALTGQSVTASGGTLTPAFAVPLTGQSATAARGTLTPTLALALTGSALTTAGGALTSTFAVPLTGQVATTAPGTLTPAFSIPLTGQSATAAGGTLTPTSGAADTNVALTGLSVTTARGSLTPAFAVALTGQAATTARGTLTAAFAVPLTGQAVTGSSGTLTPAFSIALTGQAATTAGGTLTPSSALDYTVALTGLSITTARGTLTPSFSIALAGQSVSTGAGVLGFPQTINLALTGHALAVSAGQLFPSMFWHVISSGKTLTWADASGAVTVTWTSINQGSKTVQWAQQDTEHAPDWEPISGTGKNPGWT